LVNSNTGTTCVARRSISAAIVCFLALASGVEARADFIIKLDTPINGTAANRIDNSQPYLTATFHTVSTGTVTITVSASNLVNSGGTTEYVRNFVFNVNPAINPTTLNFVQNTGPTTVITKAEDGVTGGNAVKGGDFDIDFNYTNKAFTSGVGNTPAIYTVTATGLTADSFNFFSSNPASGFGGPYLAAVDIAGIPGSFSGSIGSLVTTPVPEPTSLAMVGIGLGLALTLLRRSKRQVQL
jgi:hypothetical protein